MATRKSIGSKKVSPTGKHVAKARLVYLTDHQLMLLASTVQLLQDAIVDVLKAGEAK